MKAALKIDHPGVRFLA